VNTSAANGDPFETIDPIYLDTDVDALIGVRSAEHVARRRHALCGAIWKDEGFPGRSDLERTEIDPAVLACSGVRRCMRLEIAMELGFRSVAYYVEPLAAERRLMIFHQGHENDWRQYGGKQSIELALARKCPALIFTMPFLGENRGPISCDGTTAAGAAAHQQMGSFQTPHLHPLKFFVEPIAVALNHLASTADDIAMIGVSGGGWTTHLYAALDPRIRLSYAVAGSVPMFLRRGCHDRDIGDWEQDLPARLNVDYLDIYVLAASGPGRRHVQVINKYDSCCFGGIRHRLYERQVERAVAQTGSGSFAVLLDDSHRCHDISGWTLANFAREDFLPKTP
jgi:hypothetical protein